MLAPIKEVNSELMKATTEIKQEFVDNNNQNQRM